MGNITEYMMKMLMSVGYCHPDFENILIKGNKYHYQGSEYRVGGWVEDELTEFEKQVVQEGIRLPDESELQLWLEQNDFSFRVEYDAEERYYHAYATDSVNGVQYTGGGGSISYALHKLIYKICKSKRRSYIPKGGFYLDVIYDD